MNNLQNQNSNEPNQNTNEQNQNANEPDQSAAAEGKTAVGAAKRKTVLSGMQPTGTPSLGNYLGALTNWVKMQDEYDCIYFIADLHAITLRQVPADLRKNTRNLFTLFLAVGLDPEKSIIFCHSSVPQHAELTWVLNCFTYIGELGRMTQFKDKSQKHDDNINAGLFTYPVLMAVDILLYQADYVPVGEDQRQHLELTRDLAMRFNNIYGDVFTVPEPYITKATGKIMGLQNPDKKMSKSESDNENNVIYLMDPPNVIRNKIKRAVTDSGDEVRYSEEKPGIMNLLNIYGAFTGKTPAEAEKEFAGVGYGDFKLAVADAVAARLEPIQTRYKELSEDKTYIDRTLKEHTERAAALAERTVGKVYRKIGFLRAR